MKEILCVGYEYYVCNGFNEIEGICVMMFIYEWCLVIS